MPDDDEHGSDHAAVETVIDIHYGRTMSRWAGLENALYLWFSAATGMSDGMGRAIFYSARGFAARAEMLEAAIEHTTTLKSQQVEFLKEAIKKARQYSAFRNKVAHGELRLHVYEKRDDMCYVFAIDQGRRVPSKAESLYMGDLDLGAKNIRALAMLIIEMLPSMRTFKARSPEECLLQVRALPNEANTTSDPTGAGARDQPPEAPIRRNKKKYRGQQKVRKQGSRE